MALEFAQQPPLRPRVQADAHGKHAEIEVFDVPELSGSWAKCAEGLEYPHSHQRRPIVFDHDLARGRDDVVLAHLNHPLVTMSLRLLRAEVGASDQRSHLHRVTARVVPSHLLQTPTVIVHARLLILGSDNQRLHEELIAAGISLYDGPRFEHLTESALKHALAATAPQDRLAPEATLQAFSALWPRLQPTLMSALNRRMKEREQSLQKKLADRSSEEQRTISFVLSELKKQIVQEIQAASSPVQLTLAGFSSDERQQVRADLDALQARADQIDAEIEQEVQRIQQRFAQPQTRHFPVSVTYIVPERFAR